MSKQEEIRQGIADILQDDIDKGLLGVGTTDRILKFLDSKGVVIKAERKLPIKFLHPDDGPNASYAKAQEDMLRVGFTVVERLIEENK